MILFGYSVEYFNNKRQQETDQRGEDEVRHFYASSVRQGVSVDEKSAFTYLVYCFLAFIYDFIRSLV